MNERTNERTNELVLRSGDAKAAGNKKVVTLLLRLAAVAAKQRPFMKPQERAAHDRESLVYTCQSDCSLILQLFDVQLFVAQLVSRFVAQLVSCLLSRGVV